MQSGKQRVDFITGLENQIIANNKLFTHLEEESTVDGHWRALVQTIQTIALGHFGRAETRDEAKPAMAAERWTLIKQRGFYRASHSGVSFDPSTGLRMWTFIGRFGKSQNNLDG